MSTVKSRTTDMTKGPIAKQIVFFAFPLMLGNLFQMMYNTADTIVVGNFVGKEALAAVGATSMITNLAVFFFSGFASGASVAIARAFGAKDNETVHNAVETAITMTLIFSVIFTAVGIPMAKPILRWMAPRKMSSRMPQNTFRSTLRVSPGCLSITLAAEFSARSATVSGRSTF